MSHPARSEAGSTSHARNAPASLQSRPAWRLLRWTLGSRRETATLETFADVSCTLMLACGRADDGERPKQWARVFEAFARKYDHVALLAFCRTCCADVYQANGRIDAAEDELQAALRELEEAGQRARCVHPAARLAEIRVLQGRFEEAEQFLSGFEDEPEALQAAVALRLARGEPEAAAALLDRRLDELGRSNLR